MNVLYRKYRPKKFDDVIGQKHVIDILKAQIKNNSIAHAYLFTGPRGTGKTTVARIFAKALNKVSIDTLENLDIIEIDAASNRGIDEIRDLREKVNFIPTNLKYKVYIIDEVHMLTKEAFNALLKTIEEPPEHIIFIFATTEAHKVPITVLSRVIRFDFRLANKKNIESKLKYILKQEEIDYNLDALELIIKQGKGSYRDSETVLEKILANLNGNVFKREFVEKTLGLVDSDLVEDFLCSLNENNIEKAFKILYSINSSGTNLNQFIFQIIDESRVKLISIIKKEKIEWSLRKIGRVIKEFSNASENSKRNLMPIVLYEIAILNTMDEVPIVNKNEINKEKIVKIKSEKIKDKNVIIKENNVSNLNINSIKSEWTNLLNLVKEKNHHLLAFLQKSKIISFTDNLLKIEVPFEFHKKKLESVNTEKILSSLFEVIWKSKFKYKVEVNREIKSENNDVAQDTLKKGNKELVEEIFKS